jgi:hypothetical protein
MLHCLSRLGSEHARLLLGLQSLVGGVWLAQRLVHPVGGVVAHGRYAVRVGVEGKLDASVAKQVLD